MNTGRVGREGASIIEETVARRGQNALALLVEHLFALARAALHAFLVIDAHGAHASVLQIVARQVTRVVRVALVGTRLHCLADGASCTIVLSSL